MARREKRKRPQGSKRCMANHVKMLSEEIEKAKARFLLAWAYLRAVKTAQKEIPSYVRDAQKALNVQKENIEWIFIKIANLKHGFCVFDGDEDGRKGYPLSEVEQEVVNALPHDFFGKVPPFSDAPPRLDSIDLEATATPAEGCELESRGIKRKRSGLLHPKNRPGSGASFQPAREEIADCQFEHGRRAATLEKAKPPHVALQWMSFGCVPSSHQARQLQEGHKIKNILQEGKTVSWINASLLSLHPWVKHGDRCHYEQVMDAEKLKLLDIVFCEVQPSKQFRVNLICQIVRRRGSDFRPCFYISDFQGNEQGHCLIEHIYGKLTHVSKPHV